MPSTLRRGRTLAAACIGLVVALSVVGSAEARRGGSFGSRGYRTYSAPRSTYTAPTYTAPVQRSMTPRTPTGPSGAPAYAPRPSGYPQPQRGGFLRNWGGPILGGLFAAGLFGMLMGHGFGGGFGGGIGLMALVIQLAVLALVIGFVARLFRRRNAPAYAGGAAFAQPQPYPQAPGYDPPPYAPPYQAGAPVHGDRGGDEIGLTQADFDRFERLLHEVQDAFSREDFAALRERATPEVVSYLSEELSHNAVAGRRNEVRDLRLLQGDLSEAWNEGDKDYATVAMRYSAVDLMRDRNTGQLVSGDERPTETTELWTFVRDRGGAGPWGAPAGGGGPWAGGGSDWKLSAIQETQ